MSNKDNNWWETKLKAELPKVYDYFIEEKKRQNKLRMIGTSSILKPIDYLTIGHLEEIIKKYQHDFIPDIFPNLEFFTGHMVIIKKVRNALSHMAPSTKLQDIRYAKNEIDVLLQHFSTP